MLRSSEAIKEGQLTVPGKERRGHLKVVDQTIVEEVKKEAVEKVPKKVEKKIIKTIVWCLTPPIVVSGGVAGIIVAGESGNLPKDLRGWDVQKSYDEMAEGFRTFFGVEEEKKEINQQLTKIVNEVKAKERIKEFSLGMVENRLFLGEKEMSMWYVGEFGLRDDATIVSGVIAGEPKIGELQGSEEAYRSREVIVPVAFQNLATKEFIIRNVSFSYSPILGHTTMVDLVNFQFLDNEWGLTTTNGLHYQDTNELQYETGGMQIAERLKVGDQVAFTLTTTKERFYAYLPEEEIAKIPSRVRNNPYFHKTEKEAVSNNKSVVEAMKNNKELPDLTLYTNRFFIGIEK